MVKIKRKTRYENRFHKNMGRLKCKVTRVHKTFLGIPYKQVAAQRETYYGEIKTLEECILSK